jgi:hypothetical protein
MIQMRTEASEAVSARSEQCGQPRSLAVRGRRRRSKMLGEIRTVGLEGIEELRQDADVDRLPGTALVAHAAIIYTLRRMPPKAVGIQGMENTLLALSI